MDLSDWLSSLTQLKQKAMVSSKVLIYYDKGENRLSMTYNG